MTENPYASILNRNLRIFFKDALSIAFKSPAQTISFIRTIGWLSKASRLRRSWKQRGVMVPPILMLSVTNECNLKCPGCYNRAAHQGGEGELDDEKLRSIAEEARQLGISFFVISGGEPLMRPVLLDIIHSTPQLIYLVFTNGTLIDNVMINRLKSMRNAVPMISLEGNREETDRRRGEGVFDRLRQTMAHMKRASIFFGLSLTLVRMNFETVTSERFIEDCVRAGCKFFLFLEYTPIQEGTDRWMLSKSQRSRVRSMMQQYRSKYAALFVAVPWDEDDAGGCLSAGRGFVHINARGDLEPCPFAPFSDTNVRNHPLREALKSGLCEKIRENPVLSRETGGGCVLWKERELVKSLID